MDIPDTRTMFGSAIKCEMVVDNSKRRNEDPHVKKVVGAGDESTEAAVTVKEEAAEISACHLSTSPRNLAIASRILGISLCMMPH